MEIVTGLMSLTGGGGALYVARRVQRRRRVRGHVAQRLAATRLEIPLETGHLSPGLSRLVRQSRMVRLALETPLHRFSENVTGETPWRRRERVDEYDRALVDARMAVWDWLRGLDFLGEHDREVIRTLGLSALNLQRLLFAPGVLERTRDLFEQVLYPVTPDMEHVSNVLTRGMMDLRRFEVALLSWRPAPYR